jgi:hypothetical protein
LLLAVTVAGLEFISTFLVPPWPAYDARPVDVTTRPIAVMKALTETPELIPTYNSWGFRDRQRTVERPPDVRFRAAFVGDSFLEGPFVTATLPARVERDWVKAGYQDMEAINLGVSATGPPHYYYRTKEIALKLHPDVLVLMFYSGNDYVHERLDSWTFPSLLGERPQPSILGALAPHFTWLLVNKLGLSEFGRGNKPIPGEVDTLNDVVSGPRNERVPLLVQHLKKHYFPDKDEAMMAEVLRRGGDDFWAELERRGPDREFILGWWLAAMVDDETTKRRLIANREAAERLFDAAELAATMTWLNGINELVAAKGSRLLVVAAPVGTVDPRYAAFYRHWPHYYSWNVRRDMTHRHFVAALGQQGFNFIDLRPDFEGVRGAYRLIDGHWTELGTDIAARQVADKIVAMRRARAGKEGLTNE